MNANEQRRLLTVKTTAERIGHGESTVRRKIREGSLPAVQLGGKGYPVRVDERELDQGLYAEAQ